MAHFNEKTIKFLEGQIGVSRQQLIVAMPKEIKALIRTMSATEAIRYARQNLRYGIAEATVFAAALSADALINSASDDDDDDGLLREGATT